MGTVRVVVSRSDRRGGAARDDDVHRGPDQLRGQGRQPLTAPGRRAVFHDEVPPLDIPELAKPLAQARAARRGLHIVREESDPPDFPCLLRLGVRLGNGEPNEGNESDKDGRSSTTPHERLSGRRMGHGQGMPAGRRNQQRAPSLGQPRLWAMSQHLSASRMADQVDDSSFASRTKARQTPPGAGNASAAVDDGPTSRGVAILRPSWHRSAAARQRSASITTRTPISRGTPA